MRIGAALVLAGCFHPTVTAGDPCESGDHWCPPPLKCGDDLLCHDTNPGTPNVVFISSKPAPLTTFSDVGAADAFCQSLATALPPNTYRAWLSTSSSNVRERFPSAARGFVRPDGQPFADTLLDIELGHIYLPLDIDENTQLVPGNMPAFTATEYDGTYYPVSGGGGDCLADASGSTRAGVDDATMVDWTSASTVACSADARLYCFGTDHTTVLDKPPPATGKRVFMSTRVALIGGGTGQLDQVCNQDAMDARLGDALFSALVATDTESAIAQLQLPMDTSWHRIDNIVVLAGPNFNPVAPINVQADGSYADEHTWTGGPMGVNNPGTSSSTCSSWTSPGLAGPPTIGHATRSNSAWWSGTGGDCGQSHHLYCIER
jgi:hypothetical protein